MKDSLRLVIKDGKITKVLPKGGTSQSFDPQEADSILELPKFNLGGISNNPPTEWMTEWNARFDPYSQVSTPTATNKLNNVIDTSQQQATPIDGRADFLQRLGEVESSARVSNPTPTMLESPVNSEELLQESTTSTTEGLYRRPKRIAESTFQNQNPQANTTPNPYGGVDLGTAASLFGRSIKEGAAGMGVLSGAKLGLGLARNFMGGYAAQNREEYIENRNDEIDQEHRNGTYERIEDGGVFGNLTPEFFREIEKFKNGGMSMPEKLTGEYVEGLANENPEQAVAEVENREYMQSPDGKVVQVAGNPHEQGGEKMTAEQMEEGTKVVSDNLKVGSDNAKHFSNTYDIKVKANDTYATVLDKFSQKSGLKKIVEEQEEVIKSIEKNQATGSENTRNLNLQFLSEKLNKLEQEKAPLEEQRKSVMDEVFQKQEESKPKEKQAQVEFADGGTSGVDPELVKSLALQYGMTSEKAQELIDSYVAINGPLTTNNQNVETTTNSAPVESEGVDAQAGTTNNNIEEEEVTDNTKRASLPFLPDQSVLPPGSMEAHAKDTVRLNRLEGFKISPEQQLAELGSQLTTGINAANQRPDAQRGALLAQMLAGSQNASNQAIGQANLTNLQSEVQTGNANSAIADKERLSNIQQNQRFEKLQMMAKNNTDMDYRDWLDYQRKVQIQAYNQVDQKNLLNQLFENYKYNQATGNVEQKKSDKLSPTKPR